MNGAWELRWFFREPPCARELWFGDVHASPPRTDWYAYPCDPRCGVKLREGRLEIKLRLKELGDHAVGAAQGRLECWMKSLAAMALGQTPTQGELAAAGWRAVIKKRWLRTFTLDPRALREVDSDPRPSTACQLEWTEIEIAAGPWWTINLEAYGNEDEKRRLLQLAADELFARLPFPERLQTGNSCGYPEWLSRVF